jgi:hypothetical protein
MRRIHNTFVPSVDVGSRTGGSKMSSQSATGADGIHMSILKSSAAVGAFGN